MQNVQAVFTGQNTVSPFTSVHSPFHLRSFSVLPSFFLRFFSVFKRKITENKRKTNGEQTTPKRRRSEEGAKKERRISELAANSKQTCGNLTFKQRSRNNRPLAIGDRACSLFLIFGYPKNSSPL